MVICMEIMNFSLPMKNGFASIYSSWKVVIVFCILIIGAAVTLSTRFIDASIFSRTRLFYALFADQELVVYHLNCPKNVTETPKCNSNFTFPPPPTGPPPTPPTCPSYFRYIYEDLRPWNSTGITDQAIENAKKHAAFRLVVINGTAYMEKYHRVFQSRDVFTLWGILQLLNRYPGKVKDFDMMFNCEDIPVVRAADYAKTSTNTSSANEPNVFLPPLFRYCKDKTSIDIVFPDWSFWGWPEINIKPWVTLKKELENGNKKIKWKDRDPHAYWKGNPWVAPTRQDLMKCNVDKDHDWNARLYSQDWDKETKKGFKTSNLASQCTHRFKIYIEGRAWSVSEKYILACDSPTLFVETQFQDFFTRGLIPGIHFLPIKTDDKCRSIKDAVDWGNKHPDQAQAIGKAGSRFIQEDIKMDYVYDYMFHLLNEYSKLLKFKPAIPENAVELCLESLACSAQEKVMTYMIQSMVKAPHDAKPCTMQSPFYHNYTT